VTRWVCEKIAQKVAQNKFCQSQHIIYNFGKSSTKIWTTFVIFEKLSKVNNRPLGENSPNLVTLLSNQIPELSIHKRVTSVYFLPDTCTVLVYRNHRYTNKKPSSRWLDYAAIHRWCQNILGLDHFPHLVFGFCSVLSKNQDNRRGFMSELCLEIDRVSKVIFHFFHFCHVRLLVCLSIHTCPTKIELKTNLCFCKIHWDIWFLCFGTNRSSSPLGWARALKIDFQCNLQFSFGGGYDK
jgi:hypothetical protein